MANPDTKRSLPVDNEAVPKKNDLLALVAHVQESPGIYIGAFAFVIVVVAATAVYRTVQAAALREASTDYVRALETEDPAQRSAAFAAIAESRPQFAARALYLEGESALEAGDYDAARGAFNELRERHPGFEFLPDAVEGLGFIEEDSGDYAKARALYAEIASKWPDSAAAQRQPFNLGRCFESEANLTEAVAQYRAQLVAFPGSTIAMRAQLRLDELRVSNPDLFADEQSAAADAPVLQELTTDSVAAPLDQLELSIDRLPTETTEETPAAPEVDPETPAQSESPPQ